MSGIYLLDLLFCSRYHLEKLFHAQQISPLKPYFNSKHTGGLLIK